LAGEPSESSPQNRSIRVLLHPGRYHLRESLIVLAQPEVQISLETIALPENVYRPTLERAESSQTVQELPPEGPLPASMAALPTSPPTALARSGTTKGRLDLALTCNPLRLWMRRRRSRTFAPVLEPTEGSDSDAEEHATPSVVASSAVPLPMFTPKVATLVLRTRRLNEPAICVRQGALVLKRVEIEHNRYAVIVVLLGDCPIDSHLV
jgi:hypothetical protein